MAENAVVGALRVFLGLDSAEFETGLKTANDNAKGFGARLKKSLNVSLGGLESEIRGVSAQAGILGDGLAAAGLAGAAAGAALVAAWQGAKSAMAFGDEIADTAERLKVTTDYLQEMRWAAREFGAEFADADTALENFTANWGLVTSSLATPKAMKPWKALGLDPNDFDNVEQAMTAVMGKISALGNTAQQAAIADKLGLGSILTGLRAGPGAFQDMMKSAQEWGGVMDSQLIQKAADAQGEYDRLTFQLGIEFKSAMVEAIPLVEGLTGLLADSAKAAGGLARGLSDVAEMGGRAGAFISSLDPFAQADVQEAQKYDLTRRVRQIGAPANTVPQSQGVSAANMRAMFTPQAAQEGQRQLQDLAGGADKKAASDRKAAEATRAAEAAERARISALQAGNRELMAADERLTSYIDSLREEVATQGLTSEQLKRRTVEMMAQAAPTQELANQIRALGQQYEAQNKVGTEAAGVQAQVRQQMDATITTLADAIAEGVTFSSRLEILAYDLGDVAAISDDVRYGVDSVARAINDNDWTGAFANLATVLTKVETAFKTGATSAEKYAAAAALAGGVGNVIGGKTGGAISGAASGAMTAFTMSGGNPIAAVAGGILGGLGSLFGSSKAKKQAKAQAAAQAAQEAAAKATAIANERRALEIALLEAQGKALEAEAERRKDVLAAMDASNRAAQEQLWAIEDKNRAEAEGLAKAQTIADRAAAIQDRIDELTLSSAELTAKSRAEERAAAEALDPSLATLVDKLFGLEDAAMAAAEATEAAAEAARIAEYVQGEYAAALARSQEQAAQLAAAQADIVSGVLAASHNEVVRAYEAETAALQDTIDKFEAFRDSLSDFRQELVDQSATGTGGYAQTKDRLSDLAVRMAAGDASAFEAFQSAADNFLELSKKNAGSRDDFLADRDWVMSLSRMGESVAGSAIAASQAGLSDLAEAVKGIIQVQGPPKSVEDAVADYRWDQFVAPYKWGDRMDEFWALLEAGKVPGFATGGSFEVGGFGGADSQLVSMRLTPGEMVNVTHGGGASMADMVEAVQGLDRRLASIEAYSRRTDTATARTARLLGAAGADQGYFNTKGG